MDALLRDLRYTLRSLRGTLRLSLAAVGCVALGVGGAVFIFTVANAVLLEGPPFRDAHRLVRIWTFHGATGQRADVSYLDVRDVAARARSFDAIEMAARTRTAITTASGTERVRGESVTRGYFDVIDARPAIGRAFTGDEYAPNAPRVMLIGHSLWLRKFGGRPDVVGQTVRARKHGAARGAGTALHDRRSDAARIRRHGRSGHLGVLAAHEQYTPRSLLDRRRTRSVWVLARLRPGVATAAAQAEVSAIGRQLAAEYPDDYRELSLGVEPVGETWRERFRAGLTLLTLAAALLLCIACVNIAYLLLTRLAQREHEIRLRVALGAPRGALLRQLLGESLLLTTAGGVLGAGLAVWGVKFFAAAQLFRLPAYVPLSVDVRVVAVALGLVLLTAALSGALPAWFGSRVGARDLREIGRGTTPGRRQRLIVDGLVAAEVAFSFLLLTAAMLMVRTYANLVRSDVGYRTENLQRMAVSLDPAEYPTPETQLAFVREAKALLAAQPGVRAVSFVAGVLPPWTDPEVPLAVDGAPRPGLSAVNRHAVDDEFFGVMDIALHDGRTFRPSDGPDTRRVAVVSRSLARALAGGDGRGAIGTTFQVARDARQLEAPAPIEIVGVVEDVRYHGPRADRRTDYDFYLPIAQAPNPILSIAVVTDRDPGLLLGTLQRALGRLAPTSPQHWVSTMEEELALQFGDARLYAWLTGLFGAGALLLVTIGIYGVISNAVTRRWSELGVRMAVGARPRDIVVLVLGDGSRPLLLGILVGAAGALAAATLATSLVYGVAPTDPVTFGGVGLTMLAPGLVACYLPARRATRRDLVRVLQGS